jgi:hypothetical protein
VAEDGEKSDQTTGTCECSCQYLGELKEVHVSEEGIGGCDFVASVESVAS